MHISHKIIYFAAQTISRRYPLPNKLKKQNFSYFIFKRYFA